MTHLRIEQNNGVIEEIDSSIITKLYEIAFSGLDVSSNLKGRLHSAKAYGNQIDWLTSHYNDLYITVDDKYISFADPEVEKILVDLWGDDIGLTEYDASTITEIPSSTQFRGNTNIISFNELSKFINCKNIESYAFDGCTNLKSIDLSNVTSIKTFAFRNCGLEGSVNLNFSQMASVPNNAFYGCDKITSVSLTANVTSIGDSSFRDCSMLQNLGDISGLTRINNNAFYGCSALQNIDLSNVTSIGSSAFRDCSNLNDTIDLSNVTSIGAAAFRDCTNIKVSKLSNTMTNIPENIFNGCKSIDQLIIPACVQSIENDALNDMTGLTSVTFEQNSQLTIIKNNGFRGCTSLTELILPEGLTTINTGFCYNCTSLQKIDLPSTVTTMNTNSIAQKTSITEFIIRAVTPPAANGNQVIPNTATIYVPDNSVQAYKEASWWSKMANQIKGISELPS